MKFLTQAFSEHSGKPSSSRIMQFLYVANVMTVWTINTLRDPKYVMDSVIIGSVIAALGIGAWRRKQETKSPEPTKT